MHSYGNLIQLKIPDGKYLFQCLRNELEKKWFYLELHCTFIVLSNIFLESMTLS